MRANGHRIEGRQSAGFGRADGHSRAPRAAVTLLGTGNGPAIRRDPGGREPAPVGCADDALLTSKITAPLLPDWAVRRERIERLIEEGARGPLTIVTGPPGAGKTMALAAWTAARRHPGPLAWVTCDGFDSGPETFWSYIGESLRRCGVAVPADPDLPAAGLDGPARLHRLASELAVQNPPVVLVLDDVHALAEPGPLDGLSYVLRNASAGLHVIVAARMDPFLPLHRYRVSGELAEIRAADLAFTVPEARKLLAQHGVTLAPAALRALTAKNEGWAAGLRLAAMSMEGHPEPDRLAVDFGARQSGVTGYFVQEVLNARPPDVRKVLLSTSILDRVSPSLAADLAGDRNATAVLPQLAEANAFVQPIGGDWYRLHPLFAEVLRLKLRHEQPEKVNRLHQRAASWFRRHGMFAESVSQFAAAREWRPAAQAAVEDGDGAESGVGSPAGAAPGTVNGHPAGTVIVEDLSDREREVLRYVSGMLSTAEIAAEMYISVNTVKSHLKSIFRKLGASRRGEAVRLARQLRLILTGGAATRDPPTAAAAATRRTGPG